MRSRSSLAGGRNASGRRWLRLLVVGALVTSVMLAAGDDAVAAQIPTTLADRRPVQAGPVEPGFPIDYLGVVWEKAGLADAPTQAEVRFRGNGQWGLWAPLPADDLQSPGQWGSSLVPGGDAEAYQVRGVPWGAGSARVVVLNTTDGPLVTIGHRPAGASALANCLSRAEWGADETLRSVDGVESWPPTFEPVRVMTVHHTATANNDSNPAATVRAIYVYHTVDRDWGDIAYHYLIDEAGRVYEGRWSGGESVRCDAGGDGSDFGYSEVGEEEGELVAAGHTYCYNRGNVGVALLGDFTRVLPTAAARSALESALAENAIRNSLDPLSIIFYQAPNDMEACATTPSTYIEAIAGHTDWPDPAGATSCPGRKFYPQLPSVRANVALLLGTTSPIGVDSVTYSASTSRGTVKTLSITIALTPPIVGASVSATVSGPSGVSTTAATGGDGALVISIRKPAPGCYTTQVTGVSAAGYEWDGVTPPNEWGDCPG